MPRVKKSKNKPLRQASLQPKVIRQEGNSAKLKKIIKKTHPAIFILWLIILIYFSLTLSCLYQRYVYMEMREANDSATFMQISWSILKGQAFTTTINDYGIPYRPHNYLGAQLHFILALLSPIFLFTASAVPFLVIQALVVSLAAIPLFFIARNVLKNHWLALLITTSYLFNPATYESFEKFGFRPETFFIPTILAMFYFLEKGNRWAAGISLLLAMLTKHNMILVSALLGVYFLFFNRKNWHFGVFCIILAVGYYIIGVRMILYKYQPNPVSSFRHFAEFGNTPQKALLNLVLNPGKIFNSISPAEWEYYRRIFFPTGILALLHPVFWACVPQLIMNALLGDYHSVYCAWHWAIVVPFLFVGIVYAMRWLLNKFNYNKQLIYVIFTVLAVELILNFSYYNKTVLEIDKKYYYKQSYVDTSKIIDKLSDIEPDASVMVSGRLLWFFAARDQVYVAREKFRDEVDYVAAMLPIGHKGFRILDNYLIKELNDPNPKHLKKFKLIEKNPYLVIFKNLSL